MRRRLSAHAHAHGNGAPGRALESINSPAAVSLNHIVNMAEGETADRLKDRKNRRVIPHRLEGCGYVPVRNPDAEDGRWKMHGRRETVYARAELTRSPPSEPWLEVNPW